MHLFRKLTCLAALVTLAASLCAQSASSQIEPIVTALRQQDYTRALALLAPALKQAPDNAGLWTMQGAALAGLDRKKQAFAAFHHAIKLAPNDIPALQGAAQIAYDAADPAGIPVLEQLLRLRPDDVMSHGMLAILQYQQGKCADAVVHFEKASALFATRAPALDAYGTCLVRLKQLDKAGEVFAQSLALQPDNARARQVAASVQLMAHQPEKALATLEPLLGRQPDVAALELASAAYESSHDTDKAVDALQHAILLDPHNANLYVDFAALSSTHQSFQVGIDVVNDGIHLMPNAAALYFARGVLYVQLAQYDKAQADFDKAYQLDPTQTLSVAALGLSAVQQNDLTRALADVKEKLALRPRDPILLYLQADILTQQGAEPGSPDFETAMRSAKEAVALRPSLEPAHSVLAKLYLQAGQFSDAATQCRKALELDPKDQTAVYHLIQALRKTDKSGEIPALLKRLAQLRQDATKEEREQYRYKLVEGDSTAQ
ncbi:MAG: tetratricopeptide repeat protein [Terracidiphilus sp.]